MYTVHVHENKQLTPDTHLLVLSRPEGFTYTSGQFVVLQTHVDGKPMRRSYSLASAPHEEYLHILIKKQPHGIVSPHLCALTSGEELTLLGPFGMFTLSENDEDLVLVGAGTGIAPFWAYIKHLAHIGSERKVELLVSYRYETDLVLAQELAELQQELDLTIYLTITRPTPSWTGLSGRIRHELLEPLSTGEYYICGPTPMVRSVQETLLKLGRDQIRTEKYGSITA